MPQDFYKIETLPLNEKVENQHSVWNYYRDGVSQSFSKKFRECKLQTKLEYVDGWTNKYDKIWFRYGKLVHYLLEQQYLGFNIDSEETAFSMATTFANKYRWFLPQLPEIVKEENTFLVALAAHILPVYVKWNIMDIKLTKTLAVEKEYRMQCQDTFARGIVDRVYRDMNGLLCLKDYKTTARVIREAEFYETYKLDTQSYLYYLLVFNEFQEMPHKMEFEFIRTPKHTLDRKKDNVSFEDFLSKACADFDQSPSKYLGKIEIKLTASELTKWYNEQWLGIIDEIKYWWDGGCKPYPYNEQSLRTSYNSRCEMFYFITEGREDNLYKRTTAFTHYKDANNDKNLVTDFDI